MIAERYGVLSAPLAVTAWRSVELALGPAVFTLLISTFAALRPSAFGQGCYDWTALALIVGALVAVIEVNAFYVAHCRAHVRTLVWRQAQHDLEQRIAQICGWPVRVHGWIGERPGAAAIWGVSLVLCDDSTGYSVHIIEAGMVRYGCLYANLCPPLIALGYKVPRPVGVKNTEICFSSRARAADWFSQLKEALDPGESASPQALSHATPVRSLASP